MSNVFLTLEEPVKAILTDEAELEGAVLVGYVDTTNMEDFQVVREVRSMLYLIRFDMLSSFPTGYSPVIPSVEIILPTKPLT